MKVTVKGISRPFLKGDSKSILIFGDSLKSYQMDDRKYIFFVNFCYVVFLNL